MAFLSSMNITGSALTAHQLRLDVISENVANINTTRVEGGEGPYRRKMVEMMADTGRDSFRSVLARAAGNLPGETAGLSGEGGVRVTRILVDESPFKLAYDPSHPDADERGYVELPNVDLVKEISDAMAATQAFSVNVTALNVLKTVASRALEIGK